MHDKNEKFDSLFGSRHRGTTPTTPTTPMNIGANATEIQNSDFSPVYYYLLSGIALLVAVFLFLPRVSVG